MMIDSSITLHNRLGIALVQQVSAVLCEWSIKKESSNNTVQLLCSWNQPTANGSLQGRPLFTHLCALRRSFCNSYLRWLYVLTSAARWVRGWVGHGLVCACWNSLFQVSVRRKPVWQVLQASTACYKTWRDDSLSVSRDLPCELHVIFIFPIPIPWWFMVDDFYYSSSFFTWI